VSAPLPDLAQRLLTGRATPYQYHPPVVGVSPPFHQTGCYRPIY